MQKFMEDYHEIQVAHIYWEGNGVADELAEFGHGVISSVEWKDVGLLPSSMQVVMEKEHTFNNYIWNMWQVFIFWCGHEDKAFDKGTFWKYYLVICINVSTAVSIDYCQKWTQRGDLVRYREWPISNQNVKLLNSCTNYSWCQPFMDGKRSPTRVVHGEFLFFWETLWSYDENAMHFHFYGWGFPFYIR